MLVEYMEEVTPSVFDLDTMSYHPSSAFRDVRKGVFRSAVAFEDLVDSIKFDARQVVCEVTRDSGREMVTGVFELKHPIVGFNTFNRLAYSINKKRTSGSLSEKDIEDYGIVGYENPGKSSGMSSKVICVLTWLSVINGGIDKDGMKKLVEHVMLYHLQDNAVSHDVLAKYMWDIMDVDVEKKLRYLYVEGMNDLKNKHVYFSNNGDYDRKTKEYGELVSLGLDSEEDIPVYYTSDTLTIQEKSNVVRRILRSRIKKAKREIIGLGVSILREVDNFTEITDTRLGVVCDEHRTTITRNKSVRQKRLIAKFNETRVFKSEGATDRFADFVDNYGVYKKMSVKEVVSKLKISRSTYYAYRSILKEYELKL